ncbi:hypothetical protein L226DRAFT_539372 [Lentinus tigrinus ALCF2SS1-7]|uniref:Arrestin-like N-terminal domain-containing protein n=1 Tax=Lentinus tigrinus ALCF2SS1-6 TaxID=1328759 RepID=A0A5C2RWL9_9APHY|nr:hypothetical protein L227DRAFT_580186 [Lentinus tigrinus ALCF2SS1-6]RPD69926.1 hypothetical protein L226DRAFT_539372 [Lentinus tigrinus ALCF2SS1-7]
MASQTRPEPMNASPYHSKVKVTLRFADTQFPAGGMVTGNMELECKAEKGLGISVIMVEMYAIEELTSRDHSATSTFLHTKRLFQGPGLPPSNSVHPYPAPGDPPLPSHYYHARRGITTFPFQFPLPDSSPSSIDFGSGLARLRYEVRASVGVFWKGERKLVTDQKPIDVIERLEDDFNRVDPEGVIVGENGKIWMQGKVLGGFLIAGHPACIELQVKNHSSKKNTGLSVVLTRELHLPNVPSNQKQPLQLSDTVTTVSFRGPEYIIQPGAEGVANLVVDVPKHARGVKGGYRQGDSGKATECLFEVRCIVGIKLAMGIGSKDIRLDLPVMILHPSVAPEYPPPDMYALPAPMGAPLYDPTSGMLYQPPMSPAPYLDRPMSPYAYPVPPMSPPIAPYVDQGQVWLPASSMTPMPASLYASASHYGYPASQYAPLAVPFVPPPRPSSAEPTPSQPLHGLPMSMPTAVPPPPLIPMPTGSHNAGGEREEGKGERASRIAHHLRMSSRHRSASPPAHRYHLADAPPVAPIVPAVALVAVPEGLPAQAASSPASSPEMHTRPNLTLSPLLTGGDVVSPRPMLSPKVSFSKDPFENVGKLERLAEREDVQKEVISTSPRFVASPARSANGDSREKTLPKPPVPTGKEPISTPRGRADSLFPPSLVEAGPHETPPTPTLAAAVTSLKVPRGLRPGNDLSGLDALEAKLLAEVGTRKPEKERAPDVRTVLASPPTVAPIAIPRAQDVEPPVDSAISSLTLPGLDDIADEKTLKRGGISRGGGSDRELDVEGSARARDSRETATATARGRDRESRDTKKATGSGTKRKSEKHAADGDATGKDKDKELVKLRKAAQGRIAAWLGSIDPDEPPQPATPPPETPPPATPSLRRGRSPVRAARSPARSPAYSPVARSAQVTPEPPVSPLREKKSAEMVLKDVSAESNKEKEKENEDPKETQAAPNPRSSGFLPIGTVRAHPTANGNANLSTTGRKTTPFDVYLVSRASPRLPVYPPRPLDSEVKYDVRSARGGKGGIVTSVAAIWASGQSTERAAVPKVAPAKPQPKPAKLAEQWKAKTALGATKPPPKPLDPIKPTPKPKPDALRSPTTTSPLSDGRPKMMRPTPKSGTSSPALTSSSPDPTIASVGDLTAKRARMIKSSSVPAVVSSSTATPTLSSTASLARPSPARVDRLKLSAKLPPTIAEVDSRTDTSSKTATPKSPGSPPAKNEYAFGQARLRELIKRYQGQVNPS